MNYNFSNEKITCLDCGCGTIVSYVKKLDKEMNDQLFQLDIWYFSDGYGKADFLVGVSIDDDSDECIHSEIIGLIESGYLIESIEFANQEIEEHEMSDIFPATKRGEIKF